MSNLTVQVNSYVNQNLEKELVDSMGKSIYFSNGCWLSLDNKDGLFWGTSPYGLDWACSADSSWVISVICWLQYWNEPRDESGSLMKLC